MKSMTKANAYAKAFCNIYDTSLTREAIDGIGQAGNFLNEHRRALFLFKIPLIDEAVKKRGMQELSDRFELPQGVARLFDVLLAHGSASLLADVFLAIVKYYNREHQYESVVITSASELTEQQKKQIIAFADARFTGTKKYTFRLDTSLIAGIKIMSDTMMWESSIDNYLRECTQAQIW